MYMLVPLFLQSNPRKNLAGSAIYYTKKTRGKTRFNRRQSSQRNARGVREEDPTRIEEMRTLSRVRGGKKRTRGWTRRVANEKRGEAG